MKAKAAALVLDICFVYCDGDRGSIQVKQMERGSTPSQRQTDRQTSCSDPRFPLMMYISLDNVRRVTMENAELVGGENAVIHSHNGPGVQD